MHPTAEEQLAGVRRLLEAVAADEDLSTASAARLTDAGRILRRLQASWAGVAPFLAADNDASAGLLAQLAPHMPVAAEEPEPEPDSAEDVDQRNRRLRGLLAETIPHLDEDARRRVARHLRHRLDRDPTQRRAPRSAP